MQTVRPQITVDPTDGCLVKLLDEWEARTQTSEPPISEPPITTYTQEQLEVALATRTLTSEQGFYMHTTGINWQIDLQNKSYSIEYPPVTGER